MPLKHAWSNYSDNTDFIDKGQNLILPLWLTPLCKFLKMNNLEPLWRQQQGQNNYREKFIPFTVLFTVHLLGLTIKQSIPLWMVQYFSHCLLMNVRDKGQVSLLFTNKSESIEEFKFWSDWCLLTGCKTQSTLRIMLMQNSSFSAEASNSVRKKYLKKPSENNPLPPENCYLEEDLFLS